MQLQGSNIYKETSTIKNAITYSHLITYSHCWNERPISLTNW